MDSKTKWRIEFILLGIAVFTYEYLMLLSLIPNINFLQHISHMVSP